MTVESRPGRLVGEPPELWYRDTVSCLQSTLASAILAQDGDPVEVLGAHWGFLHRPGEVRAEEYYYACRVVNDLGASLAPHHPLSVTWREPAHPDEPLDDVAAAVADGRLLIAAVDNYHLPFRPAFADVHAAHLVVVYGLDLERGLVSVSDAMPPRFSGTLRIEDFLRAWGGDPESADGDPDPFFRAVRHRNRWLDVRLGQQRPTPDAAFLRRALAVDAELMTDPTGADDPACWSGLAGLARYLDDLINRCEDDDALTTQAYTFGWGAQAQTSIHAEFLRVWGTTHDVPAVREAARRVEHVANCWGPLRVACAHGREASPRLSADLRHHGRLLREAHDAAVEELARAGEALT